MAPGPSCSVRRPTWHAGILGFDLHSDGAFADKLWVDAPGSMYHPRISPGSSRRAGTFSRWMARKCSPCRGADAESVLAVLARVGESIDGLKLLLPHQANLRISEMIQKTLPA